jgi:hypothetical protein
MTHSSSKDLVAIDNGDYCLIEPGEYDLGYIKHGLYKMGSYSKLVIWFRVLTYGPAFEATVARFYNVKDVRKGGNFSVGRHSDFAREFLTLFPQKMKRWDRLPIRNHFAERIITGVVRTVTTDRIQRAIPEQLQYSVVDELTRIKV